MTSSTLKSVFIFDSFSLKFQLDIYLTAVPGERIAGQSTTIAPAIGTKDLNGESKFTADPQKHVSKFLKNVAAEKPPGQVSFI